jgi:hypothetical protein
LSHSSSYDSFNWQDTPKKGESPGESRLPSLSAVLQAVGADLTWRIEPIAEEHDDKPEVACARLVVLLEADEYRVSDRAREEGKRALQWLRKRDPTECEMVEYILLRLKAKVELQRQPQDDPPGIAWQMVDPRNIFIKLQICGGFGREYVLIKSIHESEFPK